MHLQMTRVSESLDLFFNFVAKSVEIVLMTLILATLVAFLGVASP